MKNQIEKDWSRKIKCSSLTKSFSEKSFESTSIKSSMIILHKIIIFFLSWLSQKNLIFSFKIEIDI